MSDSLRILTAPPELLTELRQLIPSRPLTYGQGRTLAEHQLYVTEGEITAHELIEMAETLVEAYTRAAHTYYHRSGALSGAYGGKHTESPLPEERASLDRLTGADLFAVALGANGLSRTALVRLHGIKRGANQGRTMPLKPPKGVRLATVVAGRRQMRRGATSS